MEKLAFWGNEKSCFSVFIKMICVHYKIEIKKSFKKKRKLPKTSLTKQHTQLYSIVPYVCAIIFLTSHLLMICSHFIFFLEERTVNILYIQNFSSLTYSFFFFILLVSGVSFDVFLKSGSTWWKSMLHMEKMALFWKNY